mmetsp:Transcript_107863/g.302039  ORF Transcript_107863/g.302039 Transcript_107863/m.302039 type:complete len:286 (-) Transcript_107863:1110-1967(-)
MSRRAGGQRRGPLLSRGVGQDAEDVLQLLRQAARPGDVVGERRGYARRAPAGAAAGAAAGAPAGGGELLEASAARLGGLGHLLRQRRLAPLQELRALVEDVQRLLPCDPLPTRRRRHAVGVERYGGEVGSGQALADDLDGVEVVHGRHVFEGGRVLEVETVVAELHLHNLDSGTVRVVLAGQGALGQAGVHVSEVGKLLVHDGLRGRLELLRIKGQICGVQLPRHSPVDVADLPIRTLLPHLKQEFLLRGGFDRRHLQLQHVDDAHEQWDAVVSAPPLELRLRPL